MFWFASVSTALVFVSGQFRRHSAQCDSTPFQFEAFRFCSSPLLRCSTQFRCASTQRLSHQLPVYSVPRPFVSVQVHAIPHHRLSIPFRFASTQIITLPLPIVAQRFRSRSMPFVSIPLLMDAMPFLCCFHPRFSLALLNSANPPHSISCRIYSIPYLRNAHLLRFCYQQFTSQPYQILAFPVLLTSMQFRSGSHPCSSRSNPRISVPNPFDSMQFRCFAIRFDSLSARNYAVPIPNISTLFRLLAFHAFPSRCISLLFLFGRIQNRSPGSQLRALASLQMFA